MALSFDPSSPQNTPHRSPHSTLHTTTTESPPPPRPLLLLRHGGGSEGDERKGGAAAPPAPPVVPSLQSFCSAGEKKKGLSKAPSRISSFFSGTQDKCSVCKKTAYPLEKVTVEGEFYHKSCFRCAHGGCFLTPSSYAALERTVYCKHHFAQLFKEKGSYSNLNKSASLKKYMPNTTEAEEKSTEEEDETNTTTAPEVEEEKQPEQESALEVTAEEALAQEQ